MINDYFKQAMQRILLSCLLLLSLSVVHAQDGFTIKGIITDNVQNEPLIGVSIVEKGTTNGCVTSFDGDFTLNVSSPDAIVTFSYIGFVTVEMKASKVPAKLVLKEDSETLEEVVVVGYGVQKKVNLSGSVAAIEGDQIASKPTSDALSALQGTMPGVAVLRSGGEPGSETSGLRIRGFSSANSTKTLVLIDGIEGDMTLLNPNDIASVSVLKDAAACAIYGARAAAGVVLVTTKNGAAGKTHVSYNGYFGWNTPGNMPERLPAWEEQEFINESRRQANGKPEWSPEQSSWVGNPNFNYRPNHNNGRWDLFQATNWVDEGVKDVTTQQSHNVSVSGGQKNLNYLVSAGYFKKNGLLKYGPDSSERYNLRFKVNSEVNKYLDLSFLVSYEGKYNKENPAGSKYILNSLYRSRGRQPIFNPAEDKNLYNGDLQVNAIDIMKNGGIDKNQKESYIGKGEMTIKDIIKGLRLKLSASRKASYFTQQINQPALIWYDREGRKIRNQHNNPNGMSRKKYNSTHDTFEAVLTYDFNFGKHTFNALAGTSYEKYRSDEMAATIHGLNSNDFFSFNYYDNSAITNTKLSDNIGTWAIMSYFGRINYNFADKYLLEANVRYDGSSRLAPSIRWRAFPSFSGAWRMSQEKWFKLPFISNMKLRASWGQLGNGAILGMYDYIALINSNVNQGEGNYYQKEMASLSKTWEVISTTNIGVDLGFFNNQFTVTADYYWKKNDNMLASLELPTIAGIAVPNSNVGTLKSWGWELELSYRNKWKELGYQISFNLSDNDNEVVRYDGKRSIKEGSIGILEGYPLNTIWGYKTDGYWSSRDEYLAYKQAHPGYESFNDARVSGGDTKYVAQGDPNHKIGLGGGTPENPGDLVCLGNSNSRYFYGLNVNLEWRNFDLGIMFQGVGKRSVYVEGGVMAPLASTFMMPWTIHRNYWTPENQNSYWPRLYSGDAFNFHAADRWLQDAKYIRLKNLQLGYNIPLKKYNIEKLRVYVSGQDLWEHSNMLKVFDPEVGNKPSSYNTYPFFRTWTVGLNITL